MKRFVLARSFVVLFVCASVRALSAQTPGYSVSASPATIFPCGRLTAQWAAPEGHNPQDWIGLHYVTDPSTSLIWPWTASGSPTQGTVVALASTWSRASPQEVEFRFHRAGSYTILARSNRIWVETTGCFTLAAFPPNVPPAGQITLQWTAIPAHPTSDLLRLRSSTGGLVWQQEVGPGWTGIVTVPAPSTPGTYYFEYIYPSGWVRRATSNTVSVGSAPPGITVEGRVQVRTTGTTEWWRNPGGSLPTTGATVRITQRNGLVTQTTTNATGNYSLTLPAPYGPGSYTIRAILIFPGFDVVNYRYPSIVQTPVGGPGEPYPDDDLIPLTNGVNAGMDIYVPQPVVLVHGDGGSISTWIEGETLLRLDPKLKSRTPAGQQPPGWQTGWTWPGPIAHRGYIAWSVTYGGFPAHAFRVIESNAALFKDEIVAKRTILDGFGLRDIPIDIVAHSMGGLVTRAYLNFRPTPPPEQSVDRVLMLGVPNIGMAWLHLLMPHLLVFPSFVQMLPFYMVAVFEPATMETRGARFILIGCDQDYWDLEPELLGLPIPEEDDEWVSQFSALYAPNTYPVLLRRQTSDRHTELHTNRRGTLSYVLLPLLETTR